MIEKARVFGDAAIAIVSSIGIAVGILLASIAGGFNVDLFSYLFGSILWISTVEVAVSAGISLVVLAAVFFFYDEIYSITFDEDFARVSGIPVDRINAVLMVLTAVTVVLTMKVVGIMLTSSLLILPAVTALQFSRSFKGTMLIYACAAVTWVITGIALSFLLNLPAKLSSSVLNVHHRATENHFFCLPGDTGRQKGLFSKGLIFGRRPQNLLENRYLLSEPEVSEPEADSPEIILFFAISASRTSTP